MGCSNVGIYKKRSSVKITIKFNVPVSTFSDIFIVFASTAGNILGKYSKNPSAGYDNNSVKTSSTNSNWLEIRIDTSITSNATPDVIYNMDLDYRIVDSNYTSGVDVKVLESPVLKFIN